MGEKKKLPLTLFDVLRREYRVVIVVVVAVAVIVIDVETLEARR